MSLNDSDGRRRDVPFDRRPAPLVYGALILGLAAAGLVTLLLEDMLQRTNFTAFWPVVTGAAWFGGPLAGVVASILSVLVVNYIMVAPIGSLSIISAADLLPLAMFLSMTLVINALVGAARKAGGRAVAAVAEAEEHAQRLDAQATQMALQLEESQSLSEELEQATEELEERSSVAETADRFSRSIVQSITDPFVVYDAAWRFQFINAEAQALFERTRQRDLQGQVLWEEYPDLIGGPFEVHMRRAAEERVPASFEARSESGTWTATHCYPLADGGMAVQWRDISERKRSDEAERYLSLATTALASSLDSGETLARLAAIVVPELGDWCSVHLQTERGIEQVAVAHVDASKIEFARALNKKYPTRGDAPTGAANVMRTGVPEVYTDVTDEMLQMGALDEEHLQILRTLGLRSALVVPLTARSTVIGVLTLVAAESGRRYTQADVPLALEIGRRAALAVENARHHESALEAKAHAEQMQMQAESANIAKTQFLTSMSHELRTPLNAIAGYADLMSLGIHGPTTEAQLEDLERIKRNQRHLLGIINDILNFARLDAGRMEFQVVDVSAFEVVDELHPMIRPQMAGRDLQFDVVPIDPTLVVRADREKLRQVLINLLSNAIKFTEPGGRISLNCFADTHVVEFIIRDTGIGIVPEKLESIFEPFVQIDRSLAQPVEGTGLGLAISREMLNGMGGSLRASSEVGVGSTFTVTLARPSSIDPSTGN